MVTKIFIDTWGWLTLHDKTERYHRQATEVYQQAINQNSQIYTTDYVLDETFTFFFRRLPATRADQSMKVLLAAFASDRFHLIPPSALQFVTPIDYERGSILMPSTKK